MDIDLHCHAKLSKASAFNLEYFLETKQAALRNGVRAIALTEHFNTSRFHEIYETLEKHYPYRENYYDLDGFKVFCGMEVDVEEGGHVLLIGRREDVLSLHCELEPFLAQENFPGLEFLLNKANEREMIKIGAHPFRNSNSLGRLPGELLRQFDFLELNGKDFKKENNPVFQLADSLHLPVVAGSDTHHWLQMGCLKNRLAQECTTVSQLKTCLRKGNYEIIISPRIKIKLSCARVVKKILKRFAYA